MMVENVGLMGVQFVSLFTREWIEMVIHPDYGLMRPSPSLRGSGLKWECQRVRKG